MTTEARFEKIYLDNRIYVKRFCHSLSIGSSDVDVDDIVQNTFIKVFKNLDKFRSDRASMKTWICAIAKNETFDYIRRRSKNTVFVDMSIDNCTHKDLKAAIEEKLGVLSKHLEEEQKKFDERIGPVRSAFAGLPEKQKMAVGLHYLEGLGYKEVSEKMGISRVNARWIAKRGIDRIKVIVGGHANVKP